MGDLAPLMGTRGGGQPGARSPILPDLLSLGGRMEPPTDWVWGGSGRELLGKISIASIFVNSNPWDALIPFLKASHVQRRWLLRSLGAQIPGTILWRPAPAWPRTSALRDTVPIAVESTPSLTEAWLRAGVLWLPQQKVNPAGVGGRLPIPSC